MKKIIIPILTLSIFLFAQDFQYIGNAKCKMCHKKVEKGAQYPKWEATSHAGAFETLKSEHSAQIANDKGVAGNAWEAPECLKCHVTGFGANGYEVMGNDFWNPAVDDKAGLKMVKRMKGLQSVGCEACHGPGSKYKSKKAKLAIVAGEIEASSVGLLEVNKATCTTCHNEESPTYKPINLVFNDNYHGNSTKNGNSNGDITYSIGSYKSKSITASIPETSNINVDINIPKNSIIYYNKFALIIGNEDYSSFQLNLTNESDVDYAVNDAKIFRKYATNVLGVPEDNIIYLANAKTVEMHKAINKLKKIAKNMYGEAELIFYYAGHGFPDENTREPYLIPVDVGGSDLNFALKLNEVYSKLTEYPTKRVTIFLDACFSGGGRNQGLLASRGIRIIPKNTLLNGNIIVFTSSSGNQSSLQYKDKQHGMFTYFLLKKLQESKGNATYGELSDYLKKQVGIKSIMINSKEQNPKILVGSNVKEGWQNWKLR